MKKALLGVLATLLSTIVGAQAGNYPVGSTVADFTVTDTHGTVHHLNDYAAAGKYVLLDFFFYHCGPCQAHAPFYSELYQTYGCNSDKLICIEVNDGEDTDELAAAFSEDFAPGFAHPPVVGSGGGAELTNTFGVTAFPTFCLISPGHIMLNNDIWPVSDMSTFVAAFPADSDITPHPCATTGIHEVSAARTMVVRPTVTTGEITVSFAGSNSDRAEVQVYDVLGQPVQRISNGLLPGAERTIDLSGLANGQYLIKLIVNGGATVTQRVVLAR